MSDIELKEVVGGVSWGFWAIIGGAVSFILGMIDGIANPVACGK